MKKRVTGREQISRALLNGEIDNMTTREIGERYGLVPKYAYSIMRSFLELGFKDQRGRLLHVTDTDVNEERILTKYKRWYFV